MSVSFPGLPAVRLLFSSCHSVVLRCIVLMLVLATLPALNVQTVQGLLAGYEPHLDATLEQHPAALSRLVLATAGEELGSDSSSSPACVSATLFVALLPLVGTQIPAADRAALPSFKRLLPPAQAPPYA